MFPSKTSRHHPFTNTSMNPDPRSISRPLRKQRPGLRQIAVGLLIGFILFVFLGSVIQRILRGPDPSESSISGSLTIQAPKDADVFIGNRHMGRGDFILNWNDLLNPNDRSALAITLQPETPPPLSPPHGGLNGSAIAPEGTEIIWAQASTSGSTKNSRHSLQFAWWNVLLRHPDGQLDTAIVLDGQYQLGPQIQQRFLIPVRIRRKSSDDPSEFFSPRMGKIFISNSNSFFLPSTKAPDVHLLVQIRSTSAPSEIVEEYDQNKLWIPSKE